MCQKCANDEDEWHIQVASHLEDERQEFRMNISSCLSHASALEESGNVADAVGLYGCVLQELAEVDGMDRHRVLACQQRLERSRVAALEARLGLADTQERHGELREALQTYLQLLHNLREVDGLDQQRVQTCCERLKSVQDRADEELKTSISGCLSHASALEESGNVADAAGLYAGVLQKLAEVDGMDYQRVSACRQRLERLRVAALEARLGLADTQECHGGLGDALQTYLKILQNLEAVDGLVQQRVRTCRERLERVQEKRRL